MGLFDSYKFNPQSYGGGLLDRLGMMSSGQFAMQGASPEAQQTIPYGGQQVPIFGQPDPAALPPNAQPTQYQAPQQQQPSPGIGGSLMAGFQGFAEGGRQGGFLGALAGGMGGLSRGETRENQTVRALMSAGMDKDMATTVASDPNLLRAVMPQMTGATGKTDDIKEFEYARQQGFKGSLEQWMQRKRAGGGEYGLQPVWGRDKDGNPVMLQAGKSGDAIQTRLPEGVTLSGKDPLKMDAGTHFVLMDPLTRQVIGTVPKDLRGKESETTIGKGQGEARLILPQTQTAVDSALRAIDELRNHPGIDVGTGLSSVIDPRSWIPGQPGYDFSAKNQQAKGKSFMAAREALKGAGQVTDFEGMKGEQAIANLDAAQSKEQYLKALEELERMLRSSYDDLRKKAGVPATSTANKPGGKTSSGLQWSVD